MTNKRDELLAGALPPKEHRASVIAQGKKKGEKAILRQNRKAQNHFVPHWERNGKKESTIQAEILSFLRGQGFWTHKAKAVNLVGTKDNMHLAYTQRGVPDILALKDGRFVAIEVKAAKHDVKVSDDQLAQMARIRELGAHAFASHSVDHVKEYLKQTNELREFVKWPIAQTRDNFIPVYQELKR